MLHVLYKMELTLLLIKGPLTIMDTIYSLIHTPYNIKENGLLLVEKRAGSEIRKTTTNEYYS